MFGYHKATFKGAIKYTIDLGSSSIGNITRIDNALVKPTGHLKEARAKLVDLHHQMESARAEAMKPFAMETELQQKSGWTRQLSSPWNADTRPLFQEPRKG